MMVVVTVGFDVLAVGFDVNNIVMGVSAMLVDVLVIVDGLLSVNKEVLYML